jgi:amino acid transporter
MEVSGILGLLILIADVWAILNIFQSSSSTGSKALWIVLVLVLPLLGVIVWYFAGPRESTEHASDLKPAAVDC